MKIVIGYDKDGKKIVKEIGPVGQKETRRDGKNMPIIKGIFPWNKEAIF